MKNLTEEYILLFNEVTEAIEELNQIRNRLIKAQQKAEEIFIGEEEPLSRNILKIV